MDTELELIRSALLPDETLNIVSSSQSDAVVTTFDIRSTASTYRIEVILNVTSTLTCPSAVIRVKGERMGRDEATEWIQWADDVVKSNWMEAAQTGFPLYYLLTTHFLPTLQDTANISSLERTADPEPSSRSTYKPAQILFTSHHLLAPSKRRDLASLASRYRFLGFCKVGHPGIIYAEGDADDLEAFAREVKSWQWLALRMRVLEELSEDDGQRRPRSHGSWEELTKMGDAIAWLANLHRDHLLLDVGFGGSGAKR